MQNIHPRNRRWCSASCGTPPGEEVLDWACACTGCINGALSWDEWVAWQQREAERGPSPYIERVDEELFKPSKAAPTLSERLVAFKAKKRS
jgi:hypothetical protein